MILLVRVDDIFGAVADEPTAVLRVVTSIQVIVSGWVLQK